MPDNQNLLLVSHSLCPYVQRAVIALTEKGMPFERRDIDLANKPDWFLALSPTGKTPLLVVDGKPVFESNVILEFLEDTGPNPLHPANPLDRAVHRGWLDFASAILNDIAGLYNADTRVVFNQKANDLVERFQKVESALTDGPFFAGSAFSLVDAAFGPVFRYFDVFDQITTLNVFRNLPKTRHWRETLRHRPSVRDAVSVCYERELVAFLQNRSGVLGALASANGDRSSNVAEPEVARLITRVAGHPGRVPSSWLPPDHQDQDAQKGSGRSTPV